MSTNGPLTPEQSPVIQSERSPSPTTNGHASPRFTFGVPSTEYLSFAGPGGNEFARGEPSFRMGYNCFQFVLLSSSRLSSLSAFEGKCLYSMASRLRLLSQSLYMPSPAGFRQDGQHSIDDCMCQSQGCLVAFSNVQLMARESVHFAGFIKSC